MSATGYHSLLQEVDNLAIFRKAAHLFLGKNLFAVNADNVIAVGTRNQFHFDIRIETG